jgi:Trypsin
MRRLRKHRAHFAFVAASLACLLASGQAIAAGDDAISDDGEGLGTFAELSNAGLPFPGAREVSTSQLSLEGANVGELSADELEQLLSLPAVVSPVEEGFVTPTEEEDGQEVILDLDTRTRNYTLDYPARAVVLIGFEAGRCSGFLISSDIVATAGHCVHPGDGGRSSLAIRTRSSPGSTEAPPLTDRAEPPDCSPWWDGLTTPTSGSTTAPSSLIARLAIPLAGSGSGPMRPTMRQRSSPATQATSRWSSGRPATRCDGPHRGRFSTRPTP